MLNKKSHIKPSISSVMIAVFAFMISVNISGLTAVCSESALPPYTVQVYEKSARTRIASSYAFYHLKKHTGIQIGLIQFHFTTFLLHVNDSNNTAFNAGLMSFLETRYTLFGQNLINPTYSNRTKLSDLYS